MLSKKIILGAVVALHVSVVLFSSSKKKPTPIPIPIQVHTVFTPPVKTLPATSKAPVLAKPSPKKKYIKKEPTPLPIPPPLPSPLSSKAPSHYQEKLSLALQEKLHLPEYGSITVTLTINADGSVRTLKCLQSESPLNQKYIEKNLPLLALPKLEGASSAPQTFTLTFHSKSEKKLCDSSSSG